MTSSFDERQQTMPALDKPSTQALATITEKPSKQPKSNPDSTIAHQRQIQARKEYGRGKPISVNRTKDKKLRENLKALEKKNKDATLKARDAEILLENEPGFLKPENALEKTYRLRQDDIQEALPVQTAKKGFELKLNGLGPYICEYTRDGRELLLAGRKGHLATMNWRDGTLGCELQLGETIRDAKWLHNHQLFALAQKKHVYIYDRQGIEIHHMKKLIEVTAMQFLPYHFLLATIGKAGYLKYNDISTGELVTEFPTKQGTPTAFGQNPHNAIMHVGHQNGRISLYSPNSTAPLAQVLAHSGPVRSLAVNRSGHYMVSAGQDSKMTVFDVRMFKPVHEYYLSRPGSSLAISDQDVVAVSSAAQASIWQGLFDKSKEDQEKQKRPYMAWGNEGSKIERVNFCPLEDVLGVGHESGFSSIIVPGAGLANFDALEVNPYANTKARQEAEVKGLLNKLQPDTISLNPDFIGNLDLASASTKLSERDSERTVEENIARLKNRGRGKNSSLRKYKRKLSSRNIIDEKRVRLEEALEAQNDRKAAALKEKQESLGPALARFVSKRGTVT